MGKNKDISINLKPNKMSPNNDSQKSSLKLILLTGIIILILIVLIVIIGLVLYKNSSKNKEEKTEDETTEQEQTTSSPSEGDELLQQVCQKAINDYPEDIMNTGIVFYEHVGGGEGSFFYRKSPETPAVGLESPAGSGERLVDLDLLEADKIAYTKKHTNGSWRIGTLGVEPNTSGFQTIYQSSEQISIYDISFISETEFLLLYSETDNKLLLKNINIDGSETVITEFDASLEYEKLDEKNIFKIAVSPKSNYAYVVYKDSNEDNTFGVFNLDTFERMFEVEQGSSPVWIGDTHILYSSNLEGVILFDISDGKNYKVSKIDQNAADFNFNPEEKGLISYNISKDSKGYILSCSNWDIVASLDGAIEAFADSKTAIVTSSSAGLDGTGFWRFDAAWTVLLSEELANYSSRPAFATVWSRY